MLAGASDGNRDALADADRALLDAAETVAHHRRRGTLSAVHMDTLEAADDTRRRLRRAYVDGVIGCQPKTTEEARRSDYDDTSGRTLTHGTPGLRQLAGGVDGDADTGQPTSSSEDRRVKADSSRYGAQNPVVGTVVPLVLAHIPVPAANE